MKGVGLFLMAHLPDGPWFCVTIIHRSVNGIQHPATNWGHLCAIVYKICRQSERVYTVSNADACGDIPELHDNGKVQVHSLDSLPIGNILGLHNS